MVSDKIREALKRIAAHGYGLEQNATDEERADYWADVAIAQRRIAREALALLPQSPEEGMVLAPKAALEDAINLIIALKPHKARFVLEAMIAASSHSQEQEGDAANCSFGDVRD